jgi:hypothetical protein
MVGYYHGINFKGISQKLKLQIYWFEYFQIQKHKLVFATTHGKYFKDTGSYLFLNSELWVFLYITNIKLCF